MDRIDFNFIRNLIEDGDLDSASYLIKENAPASFELLYKSIEDSIDSSYTRSCQKLLSNQLSDFTPNLLSIYLQRDFVSIENLFLHSNAFLYDANYLDIKKSLSKFLGPILHDLKKYNLVDREPREVMDKLNSLVTRRFIIENQTGVNSNLHHNLENQSISVFSLSILHLILAERLELPIFGLPFEDRLVLIYANAHCSHNESVYEEDILFYNIVGERDIPYTLFDLELLSILNNETLTLEQKLPKSNSVVVQKWINYVVNDIQDVSRKNRLSIKYQQICELISQFESF